MTFGRSFGRPPKKSDPGPGAGVPGRSPITPGAPQAQAAKVVHGGKAGGFKGKGKKFQKGPKKPKGYSKNRTRGRLPDGAVIHASYKAPAEWTAWIEVEVNGEKLKWEGKGQGLFGLLQYLDGKYRAWKKKNAPEGDGKPQPPSAPEQASALPPSPPPEAKS